MYASGVGRMGGCDGLLQWLEVGRLHELDARHDKHSAHDVGLELHPIAGLHLVEHRRVDRLELHGHRGHGEAPDRTMLWCARTVTAIKAAASTETTVFNDNFLPPPRVNVAKFNLSTSTVLSRKARRYAVQRVERHVDDQTQCGQPGGAGNEEEAVNSDRRIGVERVKADAAPVRVVGGVNQQVVEV